MNIVAIYAHLTLGPSFVLSINYYKFIPWSHLKDNVTYRKRPLSPYESDA